MGTAFGEEEAIVIGAVDDPTTDCWRQKRTTLCPFVGLLQRVSHSVTGEVTGAERSVGITGSSETDWRTQEPGACRLNAGCRVWSSVKALRG